MYSGRTDTPDVPEIRENEFGISMDVLTEESGVYRRSTIETGMARCKGARDAESVYKWFVRKQQNTDEFDDSA
jgi:hypothetical protein